MAKAVEVQWSLTPFRSDEFCEIWKPYAELAINFGASGYLMTRQADDSLIVKQFAFFENKDDWDAYWNSDALKKGRQLIAGMYTVPAVYVTDEIITEGRASEPSATPVTAGGESA